MDLHAHLILQNYGDTIFQLQVVALLTSWHLAHEV